MSDELNLSNLGPAQPRVDRKRVGRGMGSGTGRYSGRGIKGQKSRSGSHMMRAGFEGGQMPLHMRIPKLRGATSKDAMPIGPFRTYTQPVNVGDLDRFDEGDEVTPETLKGKRLIRSIRKDVKLLGNGDITKKLAITVHAASATAREKVEAAGGTVTLLREPKVRKVKKHKASTPKTDGTSGETDVDETAEAQEQPAADATAEGTDAPPAGPDAAEEE
jgi:large subunit ribosomal protein L15